jgi:predicted nucleic acid-binding protein
MRADFKVVLDACVLANFGVCDLLLRLAEPPRLYLPVWSGRILDEVHRTQTTALKKPWPPALADTFRTEVQQAFPAALTGGFEMLEPVLTNDPKDRHVLAAAIKAHATVIVTFNLRDFPASSLQSWDIVVRHPQDFLMTLYSISPEVVVAKINEISAERGWRPEAMLARLGKSVPDFAQQVAAALEWEMPGLS